MRPAACLYFPAGLAPAPLASLAEACLRFSSQVALRPGQAVLLERGRSAWLHSDAGLLQRLRTLGLRYSPLARVALGRNPAEALALARHPDRDPRGLPLAALADYASPFQADEASAAKAAEMAWALGRLGLGDLGGLLDLPAQSLGSRFGPDMALLRARVEGAWDMAWPRFEKAVHPSEEEATVDAQDGSACDSAETLLFHLKRLCDRLAGRMRGREERVARLRLSLRLEAPDGTRRLKQWDLSLPLALGEARPLLGLLGALLEPWLASGLAAPVAWARLEALECVAGLGGQRDFFHRREEEQEAFNALADRLRQRLGPDQVYLAELLQCYLPERAWKRVLKEPGQGAAPADGLAATPPRPSRLLPRPLPLLPSGEDWLAPAQGRRWRLPDWEGPERLEGGWWDADQPGGWARDYYRCPTGDGRALWVFRAAGDAHGPAWLHGFFD